MYNKLKGLLVFVLYFFGESCAAQSWQRIEQASLDIRYQIPQSWFLSGYLDEHPCQCMKMMLNVATDRSTSMVLLASKESSLPKMKEQHLWSHSFSTTGEESILATSHTQLTQERVVCNEDKGLQVQRYSAKVGNWNYIVYFWGEELTNKASTINRIVKSIQPL